MATQKISEMTEAVILQDEDYAPIIQSDLNKKIKIELLRDYNKLHNKPTLNGVTIENNKNLADYNVTQANQGIKINNNTKQTLELETLTATEMEQRAEVNKAVTVATADKMAKETAHQQMSKDYLPNAQDKLTEGENQPVSYKAVKKYVDSLETKVDANEQDIEEKHNILNAKVDENEADIEQKLSKLNTKVDTNETDIEKKVTALGTKVDENKAAADSAQSNLSTKIEELRTESTEKDTQLEGLIAQNTTNIETNKNAIEELKEKGTGDGVPKHSNLFYRENEPLPDGYQFTDSLIPSTLIEMSSGDVLENAMSTMNSATESLKTRVQGIENTIAANPINIAQNHNNIYRGADLLSRYTLTQIHEMIEDGSFRDIYIGDYFDITISTPTLTTKSQKVRCIIAGLDTYLRTGDTELTKHHAVIVTKGCMKDTAKMNSTDITTDGYVGSEMYKNIIPVYDTAFTSALTVGGTSYLLSYRDIFSNSVNNDAFSMTGAGWKGSSNNFAWYDTKTALLSEQEVYGSTTWSSSGYDTGIGYRQLPLFRLNPSLIIADYNYDNPAGIWYWLRNVVSASHFANVYSHGGARYYGAGSACGVRLRFLLS